MLDPFFWGKILIGSNGGNVVTNEKYKKRKKTQRINKSRNITWQFSGENQIGSHATTAQMIDPFFRGRILMGSNGGNIVTNEKSKKRRKHKEYINQDK